MLTSFNLGSGEIILVLATVLIMFWAKNPPRIARWLLGDDARDAGRSVGGIFGKRAAQAITPDNQVAERYNAKLFHPNRGWRRRRGGFLHFIASLWSRVCSLLRTR